MLELLQTILQNRASSASTATNVLARELEEKAEEFRRTQDAPVQSDDGAVNPAQSLGSGRRLRTPPPAPEGAGESGLLQNGGPLEALASSPLAKKLTDRAENFQLIQKFLHDPKPLNLRRPELSTSSTPEEIESRKAEVRYQLQVMQSMAAVLSDELKELEEARPLEGAAQAPSARE